MIEENINNNFNASRFIVVEGPIGVGKTSLAKRLADSLSGSLIIEDIENNPFLDQFFAIHFYHFWSHFRVRF